MNNQENKAVTIFRPLQSRACSAVTSMTLLVNNGLLDGRIGDGVGREARTRRRRLSTCKKD
jgi:hypothetical protein